MDKQLNLLVAFTCWYCGETNENPQLRNPLHPYWQCIFCDATTVIMGRKGQKPYYPYLKLAREVGKLLGDAQTAQLPKGVKQLRLERRWWLEENS